MATMLSTSQSVNTSGQKQVSLLELGSLRDAVEPFTRSIIRSGNDTVHLHCKVPTWCQSDTCLDLHDLQELRSRLLLFIPSVISSLRSSGVAASYSLAPSDTSLCVVCALPPQCPHKVKMETNNALQATRPSKSKNALLADLEYGPALIIT